MRLERRIHIDAPPETVWSVLADVERWPEWTPSVKSIRRMDAGEFATGSRAEIELRGVRTATWEVTEFELGRMFLWEAPIGPGLIVAGGHSVMPADRGSDATLWITTKGPLGVLIRPMLLLMSRRNVDAEAAGLKRRCEAPTSAPAAER